MDPVTATVLAIGTTAVGAASSYSAARQQNDAVKRSQSAARANAENQQRQVVSQAAAEKQKRIAEAQRIRGRIRVAQAEAGVGAEGSFAALERQADIDAAYNLDILGRNRAGALASVTAGYAADLSRFDASIRNSILDTFAGAATRAGTGLQIATAARTYQELA